MFKIIKESIYSDNKNKERDLYLSLIKNNDVFSIEGMNRKTKLFSFDVRENVAEEMFDIVDDKMLCVSKNKGIQSLSLLFELLNGGKFQVAMMMIICFGVFCSTRQVKEIAYALNCTTNTCLNEACGKYMNGWNTILILDNKNNIIAEFYGQQLTDQYMFRKYEETKQKEPFIQHV